ncbi:hypothetical protein SELMODRAFT_423292 [Selaginella moellendorffii]|uniref:Uncharacterized protein n=1 Tax=Selaginella moellendorffii TaxID=88036 RepID=D8SL72_SELML|nr:hypothetical protein SELMODRAFT_423292 [Selaginella moellendorffii]
MVPAAPPTCWASRRLYIHDFRRYKNLVVIFARSPHRKHLHRGLHARDEEPGNSCSVDRGTDGTQEDTEDLQDPILAGKAGQVRLLLAYIDLDHLDEMISEQGVGGDEIAVLFASCWRRASSCNQLHSHDMMTGAEMIIDHERSARLAALEHPAAGILENLCEIERVEDVRGLQTMTSGFLILVLLALRSWKISAAAAAAARGDFSGSGSSGTWSFEFTCRA